MPHEGRSHITKARGRGREFEPPMVEAQRAAHIQMSQVGRVSSARTSARNVASLPPSATIALFANSLQRRTSLEIHAPIGFFIGHCPFSFHHAANIFTKHVANFRGRREKSAPLFGRCKIKVAHKR